jgi:hypothetical protein
MLGPPIPCLTASSPHRLESIEQPPLPEGLVWRRCCGVFRCVLHRVFLVKPQPTQYTSHKNTRPNARTGFLEAVASSLRRQSREAGDTNKTRVQRRVSNPLGPDVFSGKHLGKARQIPAYRMRERVFACFLAGCKITPENQLKHGETQLKHDCRTRPKASSNSDPDDDST